MLKAVEQKHWLWFYGIGLGLLLLCGIQISHLNPRLRVSALDVGQGDAILVQTPEDHIVLIDAGPDSSVTDQLGKQLGFFDKKIDLFVLTHPDRDHYAGVLDVLQKYEIKEVLLTGIATTDSLYRTFLEEIKSRGTKISIARNDQDIQISPQLYLDILYPLKAQNLVGQMVDDKNNTSIAIRLIRRDETEWKSLMTLTGDAELPEERELLLSGQDLSGETLKLGHHGSKFSTSIAFLAAVRPKTVVVSAGKGNKYGHPNPETLEKVRGLEIRRTDEEGTVMIQF